MASIASPIGTARMPTQGSWRPLVETSTSSPARLIVRRGVRIDEVGLTAKRATTGWPVEMPPRMPPALLERNTGRPSLPMRISSAFSSPVSARGGEAVADLDALDGVDRHQRRGDVLVELAVDRRAEPGRHALGDDLDHRADRGAAPCGCRRDTRPRRAAVSASGAEERIAVDLVPVPARAVDRVRRRSAPARRGRSCPARPCARWRRRRRAPPSRAPRSGRRRDSRGCRISRRR